MIFTDYTIIHYDDRLDCISNNRLRENYWFQNSETLVQITQDYIVSEITDQRSVLHANVLRRVTRATLTSPTWTALRAHFLPASQSHDPAACAALFSRGEPSNPPSFSSFESISSVPLSRGPTSGDHIYIYIYIRACVCVMEKARQISGRKCHRRSYRSDHLRHCSLIHVDKLIYGPVESGMRVRV